MNQRKVAVIIGGARGIGYASAVRMARDCDAMAIVDINAERAAEAAATLETETGVMALGFGCDIGNKAALAAVREQIVAQAGTPSILVNCAAIVDDKLFLESTPEDWNRMFSVCLFGALHCLHEFLPGMVDQGYGRVVCLSSDSARLGQARLSYYAAAKAAVVATVKSVAQEVGRSGVTINVVSPGATNTEMRQARERSLAEQMGPEKYAKRQASVLKLYPLGRVGEPEDIAGAVHFLVSDEACWVTGQVLSVNGGFTMV